MLSETFLTTEERLEAQNQKYFRILTMLSVPALGFFSAAAAYLGFYEMASSWPFVVLPPSVLVIGLVLFDGFAPKSDKPQISLKILNQVHLGVIVYFILASVGWLYYLVKFIELHK